MAKTNIFYIPDFRFISKKGINRNTCFFANFLQRKQYFRIFLINFFQLPHVPQTKIYCVPLEHKFHVKFNQIIKHFVFNCFRRLGGYSRVGLRVIGNGYYFTLVSPKTITCALGYSHLSTIQLAEDQFFQIVGRKRRKVFIWGVSQEQISNTARRLRCLLKPNSFKGKGIRFLQEKINRKKGKKKFV